MGSRGPTPNPHSQRGQQGRNTFAGTLAAIPPSRLGMARRPAWLDGAAKRVWLRYAPDLRKRGLLTALDEAAFVALCCTAALIVELRAAIERDGAVITTPRGEQRPHAALRALHQQQAAFEALLKAFGMTPASRGRIAVVQEAEEDELSRFLHPVK